MTYTVHEIQVQFEHMARKGSTLARKNTIMNLGIKFFYIVCISVEKQKTAAKRGDEQYVYLDFLTLAVDTK